MKLCNKDSLATKVKHCGLNLVVMGMKNGTVNKTVAKLIGVLERKLCTLCIYL